MYFVTFNPEYIAKFQFLIFYLCLKKIDIIFWPYSVSKIIFHSFIPFLKFNVYISKLEGFYI